MVEKWRFAIVATCHVGSCLLGGGLADKIGSIIFLSNRRDRELKPVKDSGANQYPRAPRPGLGGLKETKNVSSPSTCESRYCGEPP